MFGAVNRKVERIDVKPIFLWGKGENMAVTDNPTTLYTTIHQVQPGLGKNYVIVGETKGLAFAITVNASELGTPVIVGGTSQEEYDPNFQQRGNVCWPLP